LSKLPNYTQPFTLPLLSRCSTQKANKPECLLLLLNSILVVFVVRALLIVVVGAATDVR